jgi:hypothetical protein
MRNINTLSEEEENEEEKLNYKSPINLFKCRKPIITDIPIK